MSDNVVYINQRKADQVKAERKAGRKLLRSLYRPLDEVERDNAETAEREREGRRITNQGVRRRYGLDRRK